MESATSRGVVSMRIFAKNSQEQLRILNTSFRPFRELTTGRDHRRFPNRLEMNGINREKSSELSQAMQ